MNNQTILILTGKTASGKDTLMHRLLQIYPHFKKVITTTSRALREGEKDGQDYFFISREEFQNKIQNDDFIEYVEYAGNLYGTDKKALNQESDLIWRIDPSRAGQIKEQIKDKKVIVVYLTTDDDVVLKRLKERGLSNAEIEARMREDKLFWDTYKDKYDYVVENIPGQLEKTLDKIRQIIENHAS